LKNNILNKSDKSIAIVIPYYNAANHICDVVQQIPNFVNAIIIVNDKSKDVIPIEALKKATALPIIFINNDLNLGVGGATKKGFQYGIDNKFDVLIKVDADNQMDTSYLKQMLKPLLKGKAEVTKGNRFRDTKTLQKMPLIRRFGNLGLSFLTKIATGYWNNFDPTNGFIAIQTKTLKNIDFDNLENRYFFETSLMSELYFQRARIKDISMPPIYSNEKSSMQVWKMPFVFSTKLTFLFIKRIVKSYFLFDFNIGSIYFIFGNLLFLFGIIFGIIKWSFYASANLPTPTGTIMIATISLILGFQLLLQFIQYDILNAPKT
jgi:dolichol-phosphate mannosyltransferase